MSIAPAAAHAVIRLHPNDDVVIATRQLIPGTRLEAEDLVVAGLVPPGHKVATRAIAQGEPVKRYNQIIGVAREPIARGQHVHVHNLGMAEFAREHAFGADVHPTRHVSDPAQFMGIRRADGRVATRNFVGILTSVNCSATVARAIADHFRRDVHPEALAEFPNVDGVVALTHGLGCGIDSQGEGIAILRRTLAGYAVHPNFASVLFVGLGCETNQIGSVLEAGGLREDPARLRAFTIQESGGTRKTVERGIAMVRELLADANRVTREPVPASHLSVGLQCGGSDGYSGISANPALGAAVDRLVAHGGTAILSETPEIYGAEHLLTRRAVSREVGEKLLARIAWWQDYCARNHAALDNNPSAGNKAGGLTTILEKSLGAVAKGGTTNLVQVYEYAEPIDARGFVFMDSPGYDPVSATGQVASGANLICFTTGRGSAYGCAPAPSLKLATNSALWERQEGDMDINCGGVIDGTASIDALGEAIFRMMLDCASGVRSKSELLGYGQNEFVPWQVGVIA
ncbi:altronate dehydratase family protein [Trinickia caryophylli]|uniref:Altronate hydrolase n=1 Tax=Trinickia caryophylli TaxID=28094 RepID=A0A1X7DPU0_TRICW|nr:altronate dehydratase family protein [Trinickia caryophylli]PMS10618.1 altronate dehydratase [Trinickia caryophylli]TRX17204.1 altronate dehydratase [Trinickia caryophylli]WQE12062.1 altronate dehydratase family protein [Trinickia caryophylli]SMF18753.1 altronate hydrolase [Trinickia caryophylli]GLU31815.1 dehydratase [Trinickia caryophylli]